MSNTTKKWYQGLDYRRKRVMIMKTCQSNSILSPILLTLLSAAPLHDATSKLLDFVALSFLYFLFFAVSWLIFTLTSFCLIFLVSLFLLCLFLESDFWPIYVSIDLPINFPPFGSSYFHLTSSLIPSPLDFPQLQPKPLGLLETTSSSSPQNNYCDVCFKLDILY